MKSNDFENEKTLIVEYEIISKKVWKLSYRKKHYEKNFTDIFRRELFSLLQRKRVLLTNLLNLKNMGATELKRAALISQVQAIEDELSIWHTCKRISLSQGSSNPMALYSIIIRDIDWQFYSFSGAYRKPNFYFDNEKEHDCSELLKCLSAFKERIIRHTNNYIQLEKHVVSCLTEIDEIASRDYIKYCIVY